WVAMFKAESRLRWVLRSCVGLRLTPTVCWIVECAYRVTIVSVGRAADLPDAHQKLSAWCVLIPKENACPSTTPFVRLTESTAPLVAPSTLTIRSWRCGRFFQSTCAWSQLFPAP